MITWRKELAFECDHCCVDLTLDQIDAKNKSGMFKEAKKIGWIFDRKLNKCLCPQCKIIKGITIDNATLDKII